ncbi:multifunctional CCA addition/repair protein [Salinisphaera sp. USBA-960]|uniref:multifunctional CCA addition/repair protein n=1 Tax=Salinisphaera orenii TaxID=856731 RepID=UPI000DBE1CFF|nr:multifunctional CCA addition/repair protein [Salifodinibacter halophilus]NNC25964.1 multifunctional CCA addition/repair protein [Salifodinibacter halophilus]
MSTDQTYLVGGAVRDELIGRRNNDRDWVVVGTTPEAMTEAGYRAVGRGFPVFLHPKTGEEYALARAERKTAPGYHGFAVDFDPSVTLEADLSRRDLTINAMARAADGTLIDPFGGHDDLEAGILRHVSLAFTEDPVRLLRVARYAAALAPYGFRIAAETQQLMASMTSDGEIDALVPERVWAETRRALATDEPSVFFYTLRQVGALARLFPELDALFGVPQPVRYHPEIDAGVHTLLVLDQTAQADNPVDCRFAALCHDFGKARTPHAQRPGHAGHEMAGEPLAKALAERLRVPKQTRDLAGLAARWHTHLHRFTKLQANTALDMLEAADALRRPERLESMIAICRADVRGRLGMEQRTYPQAEIARHALAAAQSVDTSAIAATPGLEGPAIGDAVRQKRMDAIAEVLRHPEHLHSHAGGPATTSMDAP